MTETLSGINAALTQIRNGGFVVVVDDENRENEGDLIIAAEKATPERLAFMIRHTSGVICAPCEPDRLTDLALPAMVKSNQEAHRCAFTISADYLPGMTTGISAEERASTLRALADDKVSAEDFVRPGHIFPLAYQAGGVLVRSGHTEAAVDLCRLAGLVPVGALCELVNDDGTMKRLPDLKNFANAHDLPIISIESLIRYRTENEVLVNEVASKPIVLDGIPFQMHVYRTVFEERYITALVQGTIREDEPTVVRVVKGVRDRDLLSSAVVDDNVIYQSLQSIGKAEQGVFLYLPHNENSLPDQPSHVWREVGLGSYILSRLGVKRIHLIASREISFPGISSFGLSIETIIKEE